MEKIAINYRFQLSEDHEVVFDLQLDDQTLEPVEALPSDLPDWTRLDYHQCEHCPLKPEQSPSCPLAGRLATVIDKFNDICSYEEIHVEINMEERCISQTLAAQHAISSLLGVIMATSGCPYTDYFKPMARFHLPLSTDEETLFRAGGMYLIAQYLVSRRGGAADFEMNGLKAIYDNMRLVNKSIAKRVRIATRNDASLNAIVLLDMLANLVPIAVDEQLIELEPLFSAYFSTGIGDDNLEVVDDLN